MKKMAGLLLAICLCLGLSACGQSQDAPKESTAESTSQVTESKEESTADSNAKDGEKLSGKVTVYMPSPALSLIHI